MSELAYETPRRVSEFACVVLAQNPNFMTLDGTNTWILSAPNASDALVVDPGPSDERHIDAVLAAVSDLTDGQAVAGIVVTHGHIDHSEGAAELQRRTGAPIYCADPEFRLSYGMAPLPTDPTPDGGEATLDIGEGDVISGGGLHLQVWATPGHTSDSVSLLVHIPITGDANVDDSDDDSACELLSKPVAVLTADTILGRGTTVVAYPDGNLEQYLDSLVRLNSLGDIPALPGHGPELPSVSAAAKTYLGHRHERLGQVREALLTLEARAPDGHRASARQIVEHVYADVDPLLWPAAELSVRAQLKYLGVPEE